MAEYTTAELNKLVQDGIQTIEYLQQASKNPKETYGRSAIQKPATRDRIKAWEGLAADHDYTGGTSSNEKGGRKGDEEEKSKGDTKMDGRSGRQEGGDKQEVKKDPDDINRESRDGEDPVVDSTTVGGTPEPGLPGLGEEGHTGAAGDTVLERSIGDDTVSNDDFRTVLGADHESSSLETTGKSVGVTQVREATTEDFTQIFDEGPAKIHRRLTGIAAYTGPSAPRTSSSNPVKKGIAESTASTHLVDVQSSESGAIPNVHQSLLRQPNSNAHAESAPEGVSDVSTTRSTWKSFEAASYNKDVEDKIDHIIGTLDGITRKLDMLPEIKEEIKNINKKITTLSLGLSVVENYIKSMMIIIPSSGKQNETEGEETNPDLKPVIGRDNTRGLPEVVLKRGELEDLDSETPNDHAQENQAEPSGPKKELNHTNAEHPKPRPRDKHPQLNPKHSTEPLDFNKPNASNFKPQNDYATYMTVISMIRNEIDDIAVREPLIKWVDNNIAEIGMEEIYNLIRESLDNLSNSDE
ncbi:phosphoprotein [Denotus virus]|nr:phosphoprotein [Denotus virus]